MPAPARQPISAQEQAQHAETVMVAAWQRRRRWSRTDTSRWLSERSARVLAWVRRHRTGGPAHSHRMGYWLAEYDVPVFNRAHAALSAAPDDAAREALLVEEVLR